MREEIFLVVVKQQPDGSSFSDVILEEFWSYKEAEDFIMCNKNVMYKFLSIERVWRIVK